MDFASIINDAKLLVSLLPVLSQLVDQVEQLFPQGGKGQQKLELVKTALQHASQVAGSTEATFNSVWPTLSSMVSSIVALKK